MTNRDHLYARAASLNAGLSRDDVEWVVTRRGEVELRDRPAWVSRRAHQMDRKREAERQEWLRNHREGQFAEPQPHTEAMEF